MNEICSGARCQLTPLIDEHNRRVEAGIGTKDVDVSVNLLINRVFSEIEYYLASHTANKRDLDILRQFETDLKILNPEITTVGFSKLNHIIHDLEVAGVNKGYFKSKGNLKEKITFLIAELKDLFVANIKAKIDRQFFHTWSQELDFRSSLKKIVKLNEKIEVLGRKLAEKPGNLKLESQLKQAMVDLTAAESFVIEYEKTLLQDMKLGI